MGMFEGFDVYLVALFDDFSRSAAQYSENLNLHLKYGINKNYEKRLGLDFPTLDCGTREVTQSLEMKLVSDYGPCEGQGFVLFASIVTFMSN